MHQDHSDDLIDQLGDNDVYLIRQPAIMTGDQLDRISLRLRVPRPVYPPELVHKRPQARSRAGSLVAPTP